MNEKQEIELLKAQLEALKKMLEVQENVVLEQTENIKKFNEKQAYLASIIESTDDAVIGKDLNGAIISWNSGAEQIYGYSNHEILGKNITTLMSPDKRYERDQFLSKIKQGEKVHHYETLRMKKDGTLINVALTISPTKNASGDINGASTIARDISKNKMLEAELLTERSRNQSILDNVVDGIITIDKYGVIQSYNPASERIFGYSKDEALGKNVKFLMPEPYHSEHDQYLRNYLTTLKAKIIGIGRELEGLRKDGTVFSLELAISEINLGEDRIFIGIVRDISERKIFENKLKAAKEVADSANRAKSLFLANMSHEIRTPMNAVLGYSQILLRNRDLDQETLNAIKTIDRSGQNLLTLINEILDISKIEAGKMELITTNFDLQALIGEMDNLFALRCKQKQLTWEVYNLPRSVIVFSDENKLRQVLINLLGNAIKFTDSGAVFFSVKELDGNKYLFEIKDSGVGIPLEAQENIFEPFQQDAGGHKQGGTGLGLAICKRQLELMNSELNLESELNKGTRFFFTVELLPGDGTIVGDKKVKRNILHLAPQCKIKALVVDDIEENRDVLVKLLTLVGVEVIKAENGEEAVQKVREHFPNIIFMDLRMPIMGGEEATRIIQEEFGKDRFKVVVITASSMEQREGFYLDLGFHKFIGKPFKEEQIFQSLKELLNIEFIYEDENSEQDKTERLEDLDVSDISLPEELANKMKNAAELYQVTELEKCIEEIVSLDVETKGLPSHLQALLKKYDMDGILEVLNKVSINEG